MNYHFTYPAKLIEKNGHTYLCVPRMGYMEEMEPVVASLFEGILGGLLKVGDPFYQALLNSYVDKGILNNAPAPRMTFEEFFDTDSVAIQLTNSCNLDCRYCSTREIQGAKTPSPKAILALCDLLIEKNKKAGRNRIFIAITGGGEPVLRIDLLKKVLPLLKEKAALAKMEIDFRLVTNGAFDPVHLPWLVENFNHFIVSVDGPEKIHNHHRPMKNGQPSFEAVMENLKALDRLKVSYAIRTTLSGYSIGHLSEILLFFARNFDPVKFVLEIFLPFSPYDKNPDLYKPFDAKWFLEEVKNISFRLLQTGRQADFCSFPKIRLGKSDVTADSKKPAALRFPSMNFYMLPDMQLAFTGEVQLPSDPLWGGSTFGKWEDDQWKIQPKRFDDFMSQLQQNRCGDCLLRYSCMAMAQLTADHPWSTGRCNALIEGVFALQNLDDIPHPILEIEFLSQNCLQCNKCIAGCEHGALTKGESGFPERDESFCKHCYACVNVCPSRGWNVIKTPI